MSHLKKVLNIAESLNNTHELRQKIEQYTSEPSNDIESYVAYHNIQDHGDSNEDIRIVIIFEVKMRNQTLGLSLSSSAFFLIGLSLSSNPIFLIVLSLSSNLIFLIGLSLSSNPY